MSQKIQRHFFDRLNNNPHLYEFSKSLENLENDDILLCIPFLEKLVKSSFFVDFINNELANILNSCDYLPIRGNASYFNIFDTNTWSFRLFIKRLNDIGNKFGSPHSADRIIVPLNKEGFYCNLYRQKNEILLDQINFSKTITIEESNKLLNRNKLYIFEKQKSILSFSKNNFQDLIFLELTKLEEDRFVWEYDLKSLAPIKIVSSNYQASSRLEQICDLLSEIKDSKSIKYLKDLLHHNDFNVRWSSLNAIFLIDQNEGINALNFLKKDVHPEIQKAVVLALKEFETQN